MSGERASKQYKDRIDRLIITWWGKLKMKKKEYVDFEEAWKRVQAIQNRRQGRV